MIVADLIRQLKNYPKDLDVITDNYNFVTGLSCCEKLNTDGKDYTVLKIETNPCLTK